MPEIQILSPHLADLIAAGEVVERPASVVKELVENAFDAGARAVTVELRGGGATYLRVTDDGCGMAPEDAGIAFLRHATSKLHDEQGLEAIGTMGFRGEALAAISAVSHITLTTRQRGAASGTHMTLDAGDIQDMYETGCPEGTTMIVRDLFFNTPARRKFLKSDRAEGAACAAAALRCALGRPDVSVRCIRDGEEVFFSPGDNKLDSCVYSLLGRDLAMSLLPCEGEADGARAVNYWWGMSSGVIDVMLDDCLPEGVKVLAQALRRELQSGQLSPFDRSFSTQDGRLINAGGGKLSIDEILHMDYLCSCVSGHIPSFDEILPMARSMALSNWRQNDSTMAQGPTIFSAKAERWEMLWSLKMRIFPHRNPTASRTTRMRTCSPVDRILPSIESLLSARWSHHSRELG